MHARAGRNATNPEIEMMRMANKKVSPRDETPYIKQDMHMYNACRVSDRSAEIGRDMPEMHLHISTKTAVGKRNCTGVQISICT